MGDGKRRTERFLRDHPLCCFCGGIRPSATRDHIPARTLFRGRHAPEHFEFPACQACNSASRKDEIAMALAVRLFDPTEEGFDEVELRGIVDGVVNNCPEALPSDLTSARDIRRGLRKMGLEKPPTELVRDLPVMEIGDGMAAAISRYGHKLAVALYYQLRGRPAPAGHQIMVTWGQAISPTFVETIAVMLPRAHLVQGERKNVTIGDQFSYRFLSMDDPDVLVVLPKFGSGLVICAFIAEPETAKRWTGDPRAKFLGTDWTSVGEMMAGPGD